jgi:TonB-dependent heme/hemoglobin receptor
MEIGMIYKTLASFILLIALSLATLAQGREVRGTVQDSAGRPVAGAAVTLRNKASGAERTVTTDSDGNFAVTTAGADSYEIVTRASGFATIVRDLAEGESTLAFTLEPQSIKEQVTVTATRTEVVTTDTAVPVSVVDREEIEVKGVNTVGDIFRTLPGTSTTNEGGFQVRPRIRGLESNRVLVLVDGERLNNSRTSTGQSGVELGLVDISQVETLEVARGSGSVLYGTDALAGTINIITRDTPARRDGGFRLGGVLDTFYSSNENGRRGNLAVTGSSKFFAFRVAQSLERFDNYFAGNPSPTDVARLRADDLQITDEGEVLNSQSHAGNSQATLRFFINDTNTLKVNYERRRGANIGSAGLAGPNTGIPGMAGVFNAYFPFNNRDRFNVRYDVAALTPNLQRVTVKAFYQTQYRNFTNSVTVPPVMPFFPGVYQFSETVTDTKTAGFDLQSDWIFGRHNVIAGASFFQDENTDRRVTVASATPFSTNRTIRNGRSVPDASLSNIGVFVQDEYKVTDRLKLVGGIRFDRFKTISEATENFGVDPRLPASDAQLLGLTGLNEGLDVTNTAVTGDFGAVFRLTRNVNLSARLGRSFRTPNISERFFTDTPSAEGYLVGNPGLVPETGINFDTSVKFSTKRFRGSATYFNNYYNNFLTTVAAVDESGVTPRPIVLVNPPPRAGVQVFQVQNIRTARIQGFESELEIPIKISVGYLTPYGNFSYLRGDDLGEREPLDFISPFRTNAGFRWQNFGKSYYFDYNARIVGKQNRLSDSYLIPVNDGPEPGFVTHNIGGGYYFRHERFDFNVHAGVSNLLDRYYSEQFTFAPARGRSFRIGTTISIK